MFGRKGPIALEEPPVRRKFRGRGNMKVSELNEMKAHEIGNEDRFMIVDTIDEEAGGSVSKQVSIHEFMNYIREHLHDR